MFGGVSRSYINWFFLGTPFKKNGKYYIKAQSPIAAELKLSFRDIRWYTDKAHADMMPATLNYVEVENKIENEVENLNTVKKIPNPLTQPINFRPFYMLFGFDNTNDWVWCIKKQYIDEQEFELFNYKKGWLGSAFFDGCFYAPKNVELPEIKNKDKYFKCTWKDFKTAGQYNNKKVGIVPQQSSWWYKEDKEYDEIYKRQFAKVI